MTRYRAIVADPPWTVRERRDEGRRAEALRDHDAQRDRRAARREHGRGRLPPMAVGGQRHDARGARGRARVGLPADHARDVVQAAARRRLLPAQQHGALHLRHARRADGARGQADEHMVPVAARRAQQQARRLLRPRGDRQPRPLLRDVRSPCAPRAGPTGAISRSAPPIWSVPRERQACPPRSVRAHPTRACRPASRHAPARRRRPRQPLRATEPRRGRVDHVRRAVRR
jgi:hypothetical protein